MFLEGLVKFRVACCREGRTGVQWLGLATSSLERFSGGGGNVGRGPGEPLAVQRDDPALWPDSVHWSVAQL